MAGPGHTMKTQCGLSTLQCSNMAFLSVTANLELVTSHNDNLIALYISDLDLGTGWSYYNIIITSDITIVYWLFLIHHIHAQVPPTSHSENDRERLAVTLLILRWCNVHFLIIENDAEWWCNALLIVSIFMQELQLNLVAVISIGCIYSLDWTTGLDYWTHLWPQNIN